MSRQEERSDCIEFRHSSFQLLQRKVLDRLPPFLHHGGRLKFHYRSPATMRFQTIQYFLHLEWLVH
jgi:hypothetical protein